jgi:ABC1 atypical kinase-like domain
MKKLFSSSKGLTVFDTKETVIELNGVKIEAFPSHHLDAMRGLPNVWFILLDEADFFPPGQQADARDVSDRYIAKSNPYIVMVSTPNAPEGLFERIEKEAEDTCLYKRIFLDYTYGIGKIYTAEEIEKAKQSPSFEREYNLKYLGKIGNVFHTKDIEAAIEKGRKYNPDDFTPFYSFTSDPHPGNISITDNGAIILYDYGMVGRLDIKTRLRLIILMELGTLEPTVNRYFVEKAVDMSIQD